MRGEPRAWALWRLGAGLVLLLLAAVPLALPFLELLAHPEAWLAWAETNRLLSLAASTLSLCGVTLALALPAGVVAAVLLYRTDLPLRRLLRFLLLLALFVPLPLFASAWQAALGNGGWLPEAVWGGPAPGGSWRPWAQGLWAAAGVHAVAAFPWVVLIVGQGLRWVETPLEEEALTAAGPWRVLWSVTLPRSRAVLLAAALWVVLQAATEITVTDTLQVRTFAEEVYTQFVSGGPDDLARAVAVGVPLLLLVWALAGWTVRRLERDLPPLDTLSGPPPLFPLGRARWPLLGLTLLAAGVLAGVPVASLVWKAGLEGAPPAWSAASAWGHVLTVLHSRGRLVASSLALAGVAGVATAALALLACWLAAGSRWFQAALLLLITAAWASPGPVIGLGLKETIGGLLDLIGSNPSRPDVVAIALWYGPSPLPILWAYLLRTLPCAVALLWPVVRLIPREFSESARLDGAGPGQVLWRLVLPLTLSSGLRSALAVAILSLGELGASKMVETPGSQTFAHDIFDQMHYGVQNDLAAQCLILLAAVVVAASVVASTGWVLGVLRPRKTNLH